MSVVWGLVWGGGPGGGILLLFSRPKFGNFFFKLRLPCPRVELQATNMCKVFLELYGRHGHYAPKKTWSKYTMLRTVEFYPYKLKSSKGFRGNRKNEMCFHFWSRPRPTKIKDTKKKKKQNKTKNPFFDTVLKPPGNWPPGFLSKIFNLFRGGGGFQKQPSMAQSLAFTKRTRFYFIF
jgi:hypothetical protein